MAFDEKNGTLKRTGRDMTANPCDVVAVEAALRFAKATKAKVTAVSMGPSDAGLRTALSMGVDEAYLLKAPCFAGADVPATAYTLAAFLKEQPQVDVIFCGKHSADGDTGQTGAMLAERMGIPHVCGVSHMERGKEGEIDVVQHLEDREVFLRVNAPCLLILRGDICIPKNPTLQGILRARKQKIFLEDGQSIRGLDRRRCGLKGSATKVISLFVPQRTRKTKKLMRENIWELKPLLEEAQDG